MKIYKYILKDNTDRQRISLPVGSKILTAQVQKDSVCLWCAINPNEKRVEERIIIIFGTGYDIPVENFQYINTVQLCNGSLVLHILEDTNNSFNL